MNTPDGIDRELCELAADLIDLPAHYRQITMRMIQAMADGDRTAFSKALQQLPPEAQGLPAFIMSACF